MSISAPILQTAVEEDLLLTAGTRTVVKVRSETTAGRFSIIEYDLPPRFAGPLPHVHQVYEHTLYVLEGTITVILESHILDVEQGGCVFIPHGIAHTFANPGIIPARLLSINTPGGLERYYEELAAAFPIGTPLDEQRIAEIRRRNDTRPELKYWPAKD